MACVKQNAQPLCPLFFSSTEKLLFIVEQAHWYYEVRAEREREREPDNSDERSPQTEDRFSHPCCPPLFFLLQDHCRDADPTLASLSLKSFARALAGRCPDVFLAAGVTDVDAAMAEFNAFKARVPGAGAILLNPDLTKVLLVRGLKEGASWGFPRGKLAAGESDAAAAAREVLEETGLDVAALLDERDAIEVHTGQQRTRLFVVPGIDEATPCAPTVRGEIGALAWHAVADLPATREAGALVYMTDAGVRHRFFRVWPYVKGLRRWIAKRRKSEKAAAVPAPAPKKKAKRAKDKAARRAAAAPAQAERVHVDRSASAAAGGEPGGVWAEWRGFDRERVAACLV